MTRIDPKQLLSTLSVLLAPDGGIKSALEVPRIVQLMQKFSKKLVSKCIYIHILRSSSPDLLEQFLSKKGWDLLNAWFYDALKNTNYYLCGDLVKLFALCPMTSARLKDNAHQNQAPKLIRQLSCDPRIEAEIRNLSLQVLQQWTRVAADSALKMTPSPSPPRVQSPTDLHPYVDDDYSEDYVPPSTKSKPRPRPQKEKRVKQKTSSLPSSNKQEPVLTKKVNKSRVIVSDSESDEERVGAPRLARLESVSKPAEENGTKQKPLSAKEIRKRLKEDDSDVDDLLGTGSSSEEERTINKPSSRPQQKVEKTEKIEKRKIVDLTGPKEKSKEEKDKLEKERLRERERRRVADKEKRMERSKPYSRAELRMELETDEKDKIRKIAQQLKEQNKGKSVTAGMGRIPKLPKKEPVPVMNKVNSFDSVLGSIDSKPKVVRGSVSKNKNKDLLETLANSSTDKPRSKVELEKKIAEKEKLLREVHLKEEKEKKEREEKEKEQKEAEEEETRRKEEEEESASDEAERIKEAEMEKIKTEKHDKEKAEKEKEDKEKAEKKEEDREKRKEEKEKRREERRSKEKEERREKKSSDKSSKSDKSKNAERLVERRDSNSSDSGKEKTSDRKDRDSKSDSKSRSDSKSGGKTAEKRPAEESPKVNKKYKESNMFGDMLSSIMKEKPKVKKRRLSDIKAEKEAKESAKRKEKEEKEPKEKKEESNAKKDESTKVGRDNSLSPPHVPEDITDEKEDSSSDDPPFGEPKSREVRGILVYARGKANKKKLKWQSESKLVQVEYFELDETERTNVWKQKISFAEMRKSETVMEKNKLKSGSEEFDERPWSLITLDYQHPIEYGAESKEAKVQADREMTVLRPLFFDNKLPSDPSDPDPSPKSDNKPKPIPQIDLQGANPEDSLKDFSVDPWPRDLVVTPPAAAVVEPVAEAPSVPKISDILSNFQPGFLENIVNIANNFSLPPPVTASAMPTPVNAAKDSFSGPPPQLLQNPPPPVTNSLLNPVYNSAKPSGPLSSDQAFDNLIPTSQGHDRRFQDRGNNHFRGRGGRRGRGGPYNRPNNFPRGVCHAWADQGSCRKGDNCNFSHPENPQHY